MSRLFTQIRSFLAPLSELYGRQDSNDSAMRNPSLYERCAFESLKILFLIAHEATVAFNIGGSLARISTQLIVSVFRGRAPGMRQFLACLSMRNDAKAQMPQIGVRLNLCRETTNIGG